MGRFRPRAAPLYMISVALVGVVTAACGGSGADTAARSSGAPSVSTAPAPTAPAPTATPPSGAGYRAVWRNVAYASRSPAEVLDVYLPATGHAPYPLVVVVHGGAWMTGDKAGELPLEFVKTLLGMGYAVASVNYRLSSEAVFPAQIHDVKAALRFLRAHAGTYGVDPDRTAATGESSGAHLLALLAATQDSTELDDPALGTRGASSSVRAVMLFYPQIDFLQARTWLAANPACAKGFNDVDKPDSAESKLLGAAVPTVPGRARAANPITYLARSTALPRILIAHGDSDCTTPYQGSQAFARGVAAVAGPAAVRFDLVRGSGHYLGFDYAAEMPVVGTFLAETIGRPA